MLGLGNGHETLGLIREHSKPSRIFYAGLQNGARTANDTKKKCVEPMNGLIYPRRRQQPCSATHERWSPLSKSKQLHLVQLLSVGQLYEALPAHRNDFKHKRAMETVKIVIS